MVTTAVLPLPSLIPVRAGPSTSSSGDSALFEALVGDAAGTNVTHGIEAADAAEAVPDTVGEAEEADGFEPIGIDETLAFAPDPGIASPPALPPMSPELGDGFSPGIGEPQTAADPSAKVFGRSELKSTMSADGSTRVPSEIVAPEDEAPDRTAEALAAPPLPALAGPTRDAADATAPLVTPSAKSDTRPAPVNAGTEATAAVPGGLGPAQATASGTGATDQTVPSVDAGLMDAAGSDQFQRLAQPTGWVASTGSPAAAIAPDHADPAPFPQSQPVRTGGTADTQSNPASLAVDQKAPPPQEGVRATPSLVENDITRDAHTDRGRPALDAMAQAANTRSAGAEGPSLSAPPDAPSIAGTRGAAHHFSILEATPRPVSPPTASTPQLALRDGSAPEQIAATKRSGDTGAAPPTRLAPRLISQSDRSALRTEPAIFNSDQAATITAAGPHAPLGSGGPDLGTPGQVSHIDAAHLLRASAPPEPHRQIADAIVRTREGVTEVLLDPVELGRVTVMLGQDHHAGRIGLIVERPETLDLIRRHADLLLRDLQGSGMPEAQMDFLRQGSGGGGGWTDNSSGRPDNRGQPRDAAPEHGDPGGLSDPQPPRAHNGAGRLDIRV